MLIVSNWARWQSTKNHEYLFFFSPGVLSYACKRQVNLALSGKNLGL